MLQMRIHFLLTENPRNGASGFVLLSGRWSSLRQFSYCCMDLRAKPIEASTWRVSLPMVESLSLWETMLSALTLDRENADAHLMELPPIDSLREIKLNRVIAPELWQLRKFQGCSRWIFAARRSLRHVAQRPSLLRQQSHYGRSGEQGRGRSTESHRLCA